MAESKKDLLEKLISAYESDKSDKLEFAENSIRNLQYMLARELEADDADCSDVSHPSPLQKRKRDVQALSPNDDIIGIKFLPDGNVSFLSTTYDFPIKK